MRRHVLSKVEIRRIRAESGRFRVDLEKKQWCDLWHTHFDWNDGGSLGWVARRQYLNALLRALMHARIELRAAPVPYQLFATIHRSEVSQDALYVHTPNPNSTPFPIDFQGAKEVQCLPRPLAGRVDRSLYSVLRTKTGDLVVLARTYAIDDSGPTRAIYSKTRIFPERVS